MKNIITFFLLFSFVLSINGQESTLFKGLKVGMSKKQVKSELKTNKDAYVNVDVGNGWIWKTDHRNTYYDANGGLVGVYFYQKGSLLSGIGYDNTVNCIEMSEKFFLKLGYKEFYKNKWWNAPVNFSYKYALVLVSEDDTKIAHVFPTKSPYGDHTAGLIIYDKDVFMKSWDAQSDELTKKQEESGF